MERVEARLAELADNKARRAWLTKQVAHWEGLYDVFVRSGGREKHHKHATAYDYTSTIAALNARLARLEQ